MIFQSNNVKKVIKKTDLKMICRNRSCQTIIFLSCFAIFCYWFLGVYFQHLQFNLIKDFYFRGRLKLKFNETFHENFPVFITALCQDENATQSNERGTSIKRQIEQTVTMIKSAAVLTTSFLNIIIIVNNDALFDIVVEEVNSWPEHIHSRLSLQRRSITFPEERFKNFFRICASARLFFPDQITDLDSVVYVDTDTLFLRPPEELWAEFKNFDSEQMSGLADLDLYYKPTLQFPYYPYGKEGLNSGLWMMNLTRMRSFPEGWTNTCISAYDEYKEHIILHDQDIANIVFYKYPKRLYLIGCQWNTRSFHCRNGFNICQESRRNGMYSLHGNAIKFYEGDLKMMAMFEVWKNFIPGLPLTDLLNTFKDSLEKVNTKTPVGFCDQVEGIDHDFTKGLQDYIQDLK